MPSVHSKWVCGFCVLVLTAMIGCGGAPPAPPDPMLSARVGDNCTVYFRHDVLGLAGNAPAAPTVGNFNGGALQLTGKLLRLNAEWIASASAKPNTRSLKM